MEVAAMEGQFPAQEVLHFSQALKDIFTVYCDPAFNLATAFEVTQTENIRANGKMNYREGRDRLHAGHQQGNENTLEESEDVRTQLDRLQYEVSEPCILEWVDGPASMPVQLKVGCTVRAVYSNGSSSSRRNNTWERFYGASEDAATLDVDLEADVEKYEEEIHGTSTSTCGSFEKERKKYADTFLYQAWSFLLHDEEDEMVVRHVAGNNSTFADESSCSVAARDRHRRSFDGDDIFSDEDAEEGATYEDDEKKVAVLPDGDGLINEEPKIVRHQVDSHSCSETNATLRRQRWEREKLEFSQIMFELFCSSDEPDAVSVGGTSATDEKKVEEDKVSKTATPRTPEVGINDAAAMSPATRRKVLEEGVFVSPKSRFSSPGERSTQDEVFWSPVSTSNAEEPRLESPESKNTEDDPNRKDTEPPRETLPQPHVGPVSWAATRDEQGGRSPVLASTAGAVEDEEEEAPVGLANKSKTETSADSASTNSNNLEDIDPPTTRTSDCSTTRARTSSLSKSLGFEVGDEKSVETFLSHVQACSFRDNLLSRCERNLEFTFSLALDEGGQSTWARHWDRQDCQYDVFLLVSGRGAPPVVVGRRGHAPAERSGTTSSFADHQTSMEATQLPRLHMFHGSNYGVMRASSLLTQESGLVRVQVPESLLFPNSVAGRVSFSRTVLRSSALFTKKDLVEVLLAVKRSGFSCLQHDFIDIVDSDQDEETSKRVASLAPAADVELGAAAAGSCSTPSKKLAARPGEKATTDHDANREDTTIRKLVDLVEKRRWSSAAVSTSADDIDTTTARPLPAVSSLKKQILQQAMRLQTRWEETLRDNIIHSGTRKRGRKSKTATAGEVDRADTTTGVVQEVTGEGSSIAALNMDYTRPAVVSERDVVVQEDPNTVRGARGLIPPEVQVAANVPQNKAGPSPEVVQQTSVLRALVRVHALNARPRWIPLDLQPFVTTAKVDDWVPDSTTDIFRMD
ncbi:unnamed protein product [Amoebophrya sp. A120]|nr:unnamed protein product [Amoebophrya sp. A120]|eukprot:GSA120T00024759001.1